MARRAHRAGGTRLAAEEFLLNLAAVVLNLSLAALVLRVRPRRPGNGLLACVLVLNALLAVATLAALATGVDPATPRGQAFVVLAYFVNLASTLPLAFLPLVVPWPRGATWRRAVATVAVALFLAEGFRIGAGLAQLLAGRAPTDLVEFPFGTFLIHGSAILGTLLLLDATLASTGPFQRRVAATLLAAFVLRLTAQGVPTLVPGLAWPPAVGRVVDAHSEPGVILATQALGVAVVVAALAVPLALVSNRLCKGAGTGSLAGDALVAAMLPLGYVLGWTLQVPAIEYTIVRPILLAYGILQFQMLGVDARRSEGILGAGILAGLLAVFVLAGRAASLVAGEAASGLALVATLGVAGALAPPLFRLLLHPAEADAPRRLLVYCAALEAAQRDGNASAEATLKALRRELGVSDKEHALLAGNAGGAVAAGLAPGDVLLGRYRVVRPLGRGASGEVVLARDERLQRDVAIKRLSGHARRDARAVQSFEREMRLASALHHANVVAVHDVEAIGDDAFLIMEYLPGGSLQDRIEGAGALPEEEARRVTLDVLAALATIHARGIVHRDVKPSNVLLDAAGLAKLADFNVARDVVSGETVGGASERLVGTWGYMSPEQARGLPASVRSDLYAAGATLHACLTGAAPVKIDGEDDHAARVRIVREPPAPPLPGVSEATNAALAKALARAPGERFASAEEMAAALSG